MKCRMLTWTDLAILSSIHGIRCPAFLSYVRNEEDIFYAIFTDAFQSKEEKEIYYAVELGGYDAVAGSRLNHDSEETIELWEKMSPKRGKE